MTWRSSWDHPHFNQIGYLTGLQEHPLFDSIAMLGMNASPEPTIGRTNAWESA